jgi:hypothetical protein
MPWLRQHCQLCCRPASHTSHELSLEAFMISRPALWSANALLLASRKYRYGKADLRGQVILSNTRKGAMPQPFMRRQTPSRWEEGLRLLAGCCRSSSAQAEQNNAATVVGLQGTAGVPALLQREELISTRVRHVTHQRPLTGSTNHEASDLKGGTCR